MKYYLAVVFCLIVGQPLAAQTAYEQFCLRLPRTAVKPGVEYQPAIPGGHGERVVIKQRISWLWFGICAWCTAALLKQARFAQTSSSQMVWSAGSVLATALGLRELNILRKPGVIMSIDAQGIFREGEYVITWKDLNRIVRIEEHNQNGSVITELIFQGASGQRLWAYSFGSPAILSNNPITEEDLLKLISYFRNR